MNFIVEVKEITLEEDKRIFQSINKIMLNSLILQHAINSIEYIEFRRKLSNSNPKDISIKIVKKERPYIFQVCAIIGSDFSTWTHDDVFQLEKDVLFAEGFENQLPVLALESVTELFERASRSHNLEFIME